MTEARWLSADDTARYLSVRAERLRPMVRAGRLPPPSYHLGKTQPRWDRLALDQVMKGQRPTPDAQAVAQRVADDILRKAARSQGRNRRDVHLSAEEQRGADREDG